MDIWFSPSLLVIMKSTIMSIQVQDFVWLQHMITLVLDMHQAVEFLGHGMTQSWNLWEITRMFFQVHYFIKYTFLPEMYLGSIFFHILPSSCYHLPFLFLPS